MNGSPDRSQFWAKLTYKDNDRSTGEIVDWHPLLAQLLRWCRYPMLQKKPDGR